MLSNNDDVGGRQGNPQPSPQQGHGAQQQQAMNGANGVVNAQHPGAESMQNGMGGRDEPAPISLQQMQAAFELVKRLRDEYKNFATPRPQAEVMVPDDQRIEHNAAIELLHPLISEVDQKLPYYAIFMKEHLIKKLIVMIHAVNVQRELLSEQGPQKYILSLEHVKVIVNYILHVRMMFDTLLTATGAARLPMVGQLDTDSNVPGQPGIVPTSASEPASSLLQPPSH